MNDETLAAAAAAGNEQAFTELFARYKRFFLWATIKEVQNRAIAEEIAQTTWLKAYAHISRFDAKIGPFKSWLNGIRTRLVIDYVRRRKAVNFTDYDDEIFKSTTRLDPQPFVGDEDLKRAVGSLPVDLCAAVQATYLADRTLTEAASVLGVSVTTVHRRLKLALRLLRVDMA